MNLLFGTPKPARLLERILTLATSAGNLVLNYHIGIEQLDYIETLTVERLIATRRTDY